MQISRQYSSQYAEVQPLTSHQIDLVCMAIIFVGFFSCLIRTDYNLAVIFFCYFVWQQRKDQFALNIVKYSTILLIIIDFIFVFVEMRVWLSNDPGNQIWDTLRPMHNFGVFCYSLIMILKILLLVLTFKAKPKIRRQTSEEASLYG